MAIERGREAKTYGNFLRDLLFLGFVLLKYVSKTTDTGAIMYNTYPLFDLPSLKQASNVD